MINKFYYLLGKEYYFLAVFTFFLIICSTLLEVLGISLVPILISYIVDPLLIKNKIPTFIDDNYFILIIKNIDNAKLVFFGVTFIFVIFLIKNLINLLALYIEAKLSSKIRIKNTKRLMKYYLFLPYLFHSKKNPSTLIRNIMVGVNNSAEFILSFIKLIKEIIFLIIIFILLFYVDFKVTLFSSSILILFLIIYIQIIKKALIFRGKKQNAYKTLEIKILRQVLSSIKETKVYGIANKFLGTFNKNTINMQNNSVFYKIIQGLPKIILEQVSIFIILSVTIYLYFTKNDNNEIIPTIALFTLASIRLVPVFNSISLILSGYAYRKASFDIIYEEFKKIEKLKIEVEKKSDFNFKKYIKLKEILFKYPSKKTLLNKVNLIIKKNKMISIIGGSGSGKTTLVNIILGLIKPISGKLYVDNNEVELSNFNWKQKIGYVPQDVYLLDDSIENNIIFGRNYSKKNKKITSLISELNLTNLIKNLKEGVNTKVGDKGSKISGGERQRIGIARALYSNPEILVLDEATASIDIETEEMIIRNIKRFYKNTTIINISHRNIPLKYSDNIFELKRSKLKKIN